MPFPVGLSSSVNATNPFCCVGCCSTGAVISTQPKQGSSESQGNSQVSSPPPVTQQPTSTAIQLLPNIPDGSIPGLLDGLQIEQHIENLAQNILRSDRAGRCCSVVYDLCGPCCTAPCGCPNCGCPNGETGCGLCGSLCCGMFESCFIVGAGGSNLRLTAWIKKMTSTYSPLVISLASEETQISFHGLLLQKRGPTSKEQSQFEDTCRMIQQQMESSIGDSTSNSWKFCQDGCEDLLEDPNWLLALRNGGNHDYAAKPNIGTSQVLVVFPAGDENASQACRVFNATEVGERISNIKVRTSMGIQGLLGVTEASLILTIIKSVLAHHPLNKGIFWLKQIDLRKLVCLILSIRGHSCVDSSENTSECISSEMVKDMRHWFRRNPKSCILSTSMAISEDTTGIDLASSGIFGSGSLASRNIRLPLTSSCPSHSPRLILSTQQSLDPLPGEIEENFLEIYRNMQQKMSLAVRKTSSRKLSLKSSSARSPSARRIYFARKQRDTEMSVDTDSDEGQIWNIIEDLRDLSLIREVSEESGVKEKEEASEGRKEDSASRTGSQGNSSAEIIPKSEVVGGARRKTVTTISRDKDQSQSQNEDSWRI